MGSLLSGKILGIIGLGNIGKTLVKLTQGFGLKYLAYDLYKDYEYAKKNGIEYCKLNDLLAQSDIVSSHLSLSSDVQGLIDYNALKKMKSSAILINTSRGEVIDEEALVSILDEGRIGGAALDVYQEEPYRGQLLKYNNVITTPHIGAYALEIRKRMELEATENLVKDIELVR
jgi:D-3-phosphoglycerate dehydrogenase